MGVFAWTFWKNNGHQRWPSRKVLLFTFSVISLILTSRVTVLLSICSMLTDPNPDDPLVPDIAHVCASFPLHFASYMTVTTAIQEWPSSVWVDGQGVDEEVRIQIHKQIWCLTCSQICYVIWLHSARVLAGTFACSCFLCILWQWHSRITFYHHHHNQIMRGSSVFVVRGGMLRLRASNRQPKDAEFSHIRELYFIYLFRKLGATRM